MLRDGFLHASEENVEPGIVIVGDGQARVNLERVIERVLGRLPLPVIVALQKREGGVGLGQRVIESYGLQGG